MKTLKTLKTWRLLWVWNLEIVSVRCSVSEWCYESELRYMWSIYILYLLPRSALCQTLLLHGSNFLKFGGVFLHRFRQALFSRESKKKKKRRIEKPICEIIDSRNVFLVKCVLMKGTLYVMLFSLCTARGVDLQKRALCNDGWTQRTASDNSCSSFSAQQFFFLKGNAFSFETVGQAWQPPAKEQIKW